MKKFLIVACVGLALLGCDNGSAEVAKAEAEKAKMELELAKVKAAAEIAKAQAANANGPAEQAAPSGDVIPIPSLAAPSTAAHSTKKQPAIATEAEKAAEPAVVEAVNVSPKVTISVSERKSDGKSWDALGGAPDLIVIVSTKAGNVQSGVSKDRFRGQFALGKLKLKKGDSVRVTAIDKDMSQNDPIGSGVVVFQGAGTSASFSGGSMSGTIQF